MKRQLLAAFAASILSIPAFAQSDLSPIRERTQQEVTAQKIVGLSLAIAKDGKLVAIESFGFEDRENDVAASSDTMYRWASVSKPLTAVVTMQLVKEGKLNLDADIRTLVPEFPEKSWPITSRQLLCHQGGIVHYTNGKVIKTERTYDSPHPFKDVILALDHFKESPLLHEPGTVYSYTTHGFMLLSAVAERAAKVPFAGLVKTRISMPCGITTLRPDYQWESIPHRAVGYKKSVGGGGGGGDGEEMVKSTNTDVSWKLGGGGFISTASDMARFGLGMITGKLVDDATRTQMWTRQKTRDGKETTYGLGFAVGTMDGTLVVEHSGAQEKAATQLLLLPERGIVVAIMCNTEGSRLGPLSRDLAKLASEPPKSAK